MRKNRAVQISRLIEIQRKFVKERDWAKFHTPKNMAIALGIEASELAEIFLWLTDSESERVMNTISTARKVRAEMADVFYWLLRLADVLDVDLEKAFVEKMEENRRKYPKHLAKGKMVKYTEL